MSEKNSVRINLSNFTKKQKMSIKEMKEKIKKYHKEKNKFKSTSSKKSGIYKNMLPLNVWNKCEKLYEKYKLKYKDFIKFRNEKIKERKKQSSYENLMIYNYNNKSNNKNNNNITSLNPKLFKIKTNNNNIRCNFLNKSTSFNKTNNNNYQKCLYNINIRNKFINKGLNYFIERNNNLLNYKSLSEINRKKFKEESLRNDLSDINNINIQKNKNKKIFPYIYKIRNNSSINQNPKNNYFYRKKNFNNYILKAVFNTSSMEENLLENKVGKKYFIDDILYIENSDNIFEKIYLRELSNIINEIDNSKFNFFQKDKIFNLKAFSIIGITSSEGECSVLISRLLKNLLINYFTNIKYYYNYANLYDKHLINKELIYEILTSNSFEFIRNILQEIFLKIKNEGYGIKNIYGNIFLIIFIGINIISIQLGDIIPFFIYESQNFNENRNKILNYIIQQQYSNSEKNVYKKKDNNSDNPEKLNIKLLKINEIENKNNIFNNDIDNLYTDPFFCSKYNLNYNQNNVNNDINQGEMKFIIIGNSNLFENYKINYFVKYIKESIFKNNQNNNINNKETHNLNLIDISKKLLNDSINAEKQKHSPNLKEKFISIIVIEKNYII